MRGKRYNNHYNNNNYYNINYYNNNNYNNDNCYNNNNYNNDSNYNNNNNNNYNKYNKNNNYNNNQYNNNNNNYNNNQEYSRNYNKYNNNKRDKKEKEEEIKNLITSFKTKELIFLKDLNHILKLEETEKLFKEFFKKEKLEEKLKEVFGINNYSDDELYKLLFNIFNKQKECFEQLNAKRQNEKDDLKETKKIYDDAYEALILIIQKNFIKKNESSDIKKKAIEEFTILINQLPDCLLYIIDKYIIIFNIEKELNDLFSTVKDFNELHDKYNDNALLYIIKRFNLQNKFSFTCFEIIPKQKRKFYNLIKNLYSTYNISNKMLKN